MNEYVLKTILLNLYQHTLVHTESTHVMTTVLFDENIKDQSREKLIKLKQYNKSKFKILSESSNYLNDSY